jgi:Raf kinase inhibitor-like YbhB/YbcL family protein
MFDFVVVCHLPFRNMLALYILAEGLLGKQKSRYQIDMECHKRIGFDREVTMRKVVTIFVLLMLSVYAIGCSQTQPAEQTTPSGTSATSLTITSDAFADGKNIPVKYTCHGQNISPALNWSGSPAGTTSFALIMDDFDAVYTHWVVYNLPPEANGLPEAVPKDEELVNGGLQGKIGSGGIDYPIGYFGPCPPQGSLHHYRFTLYALDTSLDLTSGASKDKVMQAMQGHILAQGQLIGVYQR